MFWGLEFPNPTLGTGLSPEGTALVLGLYGLALVLICFVTFRGALHRGRRPKGEQYARQGTYTYRQQRRGVSVGTRIFAFLVGVILILFATLILGVAGALQGINNLTAETPVAKIHAVAVTGQPHEMSVEVVLLDQHGNQVSDNTYILEGDLWELQGEFVKLPTWAAFIGLHGGFKAVRLAGNFLDVSLQKKAHPNVAVDLNGGYGTFFNSIITKESPLHLFIDANYGTAVFSSPSTRWYLVSATQTGFITRLL